MVPTTMSGQRPHRQPLLYHLDDLRTRSNSITGLLEESQDSSFTKVTASTSRPSMVQLDFFFQYASKILALSGASRST